MNEPQLTDGRLQFPGACICTSQTGPMVDTLIVKPGYGRIYLCPRCVRSAAALHGLVVGAELEAEITALKGQVEQLEGELAHEREHKLVDVSDLRRWLHEPEPTGPRAA